MYRDREHAGRLLAEVLKKFRGQRAVVLAVPRGGVPVGFSIVKALGIPLDVVIPRKLPIPEEPEAGFGAVTADGTVVLNEPLMAQLNISPRTREEIVEEVLKEVRRREEVYRQACPRIDVKGRIVILVDDGLASGYTMLAAIRSVRLQVPRLIVVAVPCAPTRSFNLVANNVDEICCPVTSEEPIFAVASYYKDFRDLSDGEVQDYLQRARRFVV